MASRTSWEFKLVRARSVSNQQHMEWYCAPSERSNWSKRGQYQISSGWNGITHILRVQFGQSEVSIKSAADGMVLRTGWEFKLVKARSVSNQQHMEWYCAPSERSNWSKRGQYHISSTGNGITHTLRVHIRQSEVSIKLAADRMALRTSCELTLVDTRSVSNHRSMHSHYRPSESSIRSMKFILNRQAIDCLHPPTEDSNGWIIDQYWMSNSWSSYTYSLRV